MIYPVDSAIHLLNNLGLEERDLVHSYLPCIISSLLEEQDALLSK